LPEINQIVEQFEKEIGLWLPFQYSYSLYLSYSV
jgi:hypothetical protein